MGNLKEKLENYFSNFNENDSFYNLRNDAFNYFNLNGFPTRKNEDWKYTNVAFANKLDFEINSQSNNINKKQIENLLIPNVTENLIVFVNGIYKDEFSIILDKEGIVISDIRSAIQNQTDLLNQYYGKIIDYSGHSFGALNLAFSENGAFIKIRKNAEIKNPIHILNIVDSSDTNVFANTKNLIIAEENSKSQIIQSNHSIGENVSFLNTSSEFVLERNAKVYNYLFQNDKKDNYHFNISQATQKKESLFSDTTISLNGKIVRNDLRTKLNEEYAVAYYNGLYLIDGDTHVDNHTFVDHIAPNCHSNEFYKGIIDDSAKAVFNGKVMVRREAQKTDAYQQNRNLVLTDDAAIYTKPELEIYADDVKCSHGATTGKIDEDQLFYMMQRGISKEMAKSLLMYTFCAEIISRIDIPEMKEYIEELVKRRLNIELEKIEFEN
jgi:Fe-S cluster assembly protein SufD